MTGVLRVAGIQLDVVWGDLSQNVQRVCERFRDAVNSGARLVVFPECVLTGYCFQNLEEARPYSLTLDDEPIQRIQEEVIKRNAFVIFGFLERDEQRIFNSVICLGPQGVVARYRKVHLPFLGIDRFTTPGDDLNVFEIESVRVGMNICYDCAFPESSRVLALQGADLIVLPTNWPTTSGRTADVIPNARALENNVYFMAINRIGEERGFSFIGKSRIVDPRGGDLAYAGHTQEAILYADVNPDFAREKRIVNIPGEHEIDRIRDRRPAVYQLLSRNRLET